MPMAKFTPTEEQREDVATMSAGRLSQEEIAKSIINPRTGRGISVKVLRRLFKKELAEDTELKKDPIPGMCPRAPAMGDKARDGEYRRLCPCRRSDSNGLRK